MAGYVSNKLGRNPNERAVYADFSLETCRYNDNGTFSPCFDNLFDASEVKTWEMQTAVCTASE